MVLTDNFGIMLAGLFTTPLDAPSTITGLKDITGSIETIQVKGVFTSNANFNQVMLNQIQVGKGDTPPNSSNFEIESPFTNGGAEDNRNNIGNGGLDKPLGKILYGAQINPTAGSGSIREVCYFLRMRNSSSVDKTFLMIRNVIPLVGFIAGQAINIDVEVFY